MHWKVLKFKLKYWRFCLKVKYPLGHRRLHVQGVQRTSWTSSERVMFIQFTSRGQRNDWNEITIKYWYVTYKQLKQVKTTISKVSELKFLQKDISVFIYYLLIWICLYWCNFSNRTVISFMNFIITVRKEFEHSQTLPNERIYQYMLFKYLWEIGITLIFQNLYIKIQN